MYGQPTSPQFLYLVTLPFPQSPNELAPILLRAPNTSDLWTRAEYLVAERGYHDCADRREGSLLKRVLDSGRHLGMCMEDLYSMEIRKALHALEKRWQDVVGLVSRQGDVYLPVHRIVRRVWPCV